MSPSGTQATLVRDSLVQLPGDRQTTTVMAASPFIDRLVMDMIRMTTVVVHEDATPWTQPYTLSNTHNTGSEAVLQAQCTRSIAFILTTKPRKIRVMIRV
jgi:hypothetical protein